MALAGLFIGGYDQYRANAGLTASQPDLTQIHVVDLAVVRYSLPIHGHLLDKSADDIMHHEKLGIEPFHVNVDHAENIRNAFVFEHDELCNADLNIRKRTYSNPQSVILDLSYLCMIFSIFINVLQTNEKQHWICDPADLVVPENTSVIPDFHFYLAFLFDGYTFTVRVNVRSNVRVNG